MRRIYATLITFAVIALGLFALPGMIHVMLVGKSEMPAPQLTSPAPYMCGRITSEGPHHNFTCEMCHYSPFNNFEFHIECMDCHGATGNISGHWTYPPYRNCTICHHNMNIGEYADFVSAGGFGLNASPGDIGTMAAHRDFVIAAMKTPNMSGANEACIACHTEVNVSIVWPKYRSRYMSLNASDEYVNITAAVSEGNESSE